MGWPPLYIFQKMKGCSSTTIIWLLFAFLLIFPLYTKYREKLNNFCNKYIKWNEKKTSHYKPNWTFFFTYKWDHFLSYFISLNRGSLSFITILVSTYIKNLLQKKTWKFVDISSAFWHWRSERWICPKINSAWKIHKREANISKTVALYNIPKN